MAQVYFLDEIRIQATFADLQPQTAYLPAVCKILGFKKDASTEFESPLF